MFYEYEIGVLIEADSEEEAWQKLQPALRAAHDVDVEGEEVAELRNILEAR